MDCSALLPLFFDFDNLVGRENCLCANTSGLFVSLECVLFLFSKYAFSMLVGIR